MCVLPGTSRSWTVMRIDYLDHNLLQQRCWKTGLEKKMPGYVLFFFVVVLFVHKSHHPADLFFVSTSSGGFPNLFSFFSFCRFFFFVVHPRLHRCAFLSSRIDAGARLTLDRFRRPTAAITSVETESNAINMKLSSNLLFMLLTLLYWCWSHCSHYWSYCLLFTETTAINDPTVRICTTEWLKCKLGLLPTCVFVFSGHV